MPKIKKFCVVHTYVDMDELLAIAIEVEKVLGEIGETPFELLKEEKDEEANEGQSSIEQQIHALNGTLIKKIKGSNGKEIIPSRSPRSSSVCQSCNMVGHGASTCSKLLDHPKCGKCKRGHKTENCGLKCSYYFGLGHIKERCWMNNGRGPATSTNYLAVPIDDEEGHFGKIVSIMWGKKNIFSRTKIPRCKNPIVAFEVDRNKEEKIEEGIATQGKFGNEMSIAKSKILTHFLKGKISFSFLETILTIPSELEYLEGLVKLAKRRKDKKAQQLTHVFVIDAIPTIKKVCVNKNHKNKTLHLTLEVQDGLIEGLVDIDASMFVMVATIVRELGIMHLVSDNESYKMAFGTVNKTLGRITTYL